MGRIWWLNFDAERELAVPSARAMSARLRLQAAERAHRFAPALCLEEPYLLPGELPARTDERVLVWCPTPGALEDVRRAGFRAPHAPAFEVLRRVNDRRFALELSRSAALRALQKRLVDAYPATLPFETARGFVAGEQEVASAVGSMQDSARLKRLFGFAGKGQWRLRRPQEPDAETLRWLRGASSSGGFVYEPEVALDVEASIHGLVTERALVLGQPCIQVCDPFGAPSSVRRATPSELPDEFARCLAETAAVVGCAVRDAGYFGPFGVDARLFTWRGERGVQLLGDLNGRFTLGWSTGLGPERDPALKCLLERTYG
jgi:hypothetical protein